MTRGNISAYQMPLTSSRLATFVTEINAGNLDVMADINLPSSIESAKYLEDGTQEVRTVNIIKFGLPTQMEVCFYN